MELSAKIAALTVVLAALILSGGARAGGDAVPLRVLFVGNSLTDTNDLPATVAALAKTAGRELAYETIAPGGFALEDHWNQSDVHDALATGDWDVVIMQQGPSALPESQLNLRTWATRWADEARAAGTRPALLTVWPESYRQAALPDVITSYRLAAEAARAELFPAGSAWLAAWRCSPRTVLYGTDGFHPSRLGTYLAALVVYGRLFKAPLLSPELTPAGVQAKTARLLQASAATALGRRLATARRCGGA